MQWMHLSSSQCALSSCGMSLGLPVSLDPSSLCQAGPGCILQLYINLNDHVDRDALRNLSVVVSMLTIATTLAWDTSPVDTQPMERPVRD